MSRKYWSLRQIVIVVCAFALTTGLLFGGRTLLEQLFSHHPLQKWVHNLPAVESFQLQESGGELRVKVKLDPQQVTNLKETIEPLIQEVEAKKQRTVTEVLIDNKPTDELAEIYYQLSFALEEAEATGEYNELYHTLQSLQEQVGEGNFRVYLGNDFFYIQLSKQGHAYFKVVPRSASTNTAELEGGSA
ncbi:MAG: hypothetical protein GX050_06700 [Firmicutes bacterium]|nr:hypothetical protein [Bacillota bacterium]